MGDELMYQMWYNYAGGGGLTKQIWKKDVCISCLLNDKQKSEYIQMQINWTFFVIKPNLRADIKHSPHHIYLNKYNTQKHTHTHIQHYHSMIHFQCTSDTSIPLSVNRFSSTWMCMLHGCVCVCVSLTQAEGDYTCRLASCVHFYVNAWCVCLPSVFNAVFVANVYVRVHVWLFWGLNIDVIMHWDR